MSTAIHPVAGTHMHPQLDNTFSDRLAVTEVSSLYLAQTNADPSLCHLIVQTIQPIRERLTTVVALVAEKFNHRAHCSLKATAGHNPHPAVILAMGNGLRTQLNPHGSVAVDREAYRGCPQGFPHTPTMPGYTPNYGKRV